MAWNIIRPAAAVTKSGLSRSKMYEEIAAGRFPKPIDLGPRSRGFVEAEIDAWIEARIAERDRRTKA